MYNGALTSATTRVTPSGNSQLESKHQVEHIADGISACVSGGVGVDEENDIGVRRSLVEQWSIDKHNAAILGTAIMMWMLMVVLARTTSN